MGSTDDGLGRQVIAAFAVVGVAFVGATLYSESRTSVIDQSALSIANNAAPSVEHLAAGRAALRQLALAEHRYVDTFLAGGRTSPDVLAEARAALEREVHAYLALPRFPGEDKVWDETKRTLDDLDRTIVDLVAAVPQGRGRLRDADVQFRSQVEAVAAAFTNNLRLNADMAARLADRIELVSHRRRTLAFGLDAVCALATLAAALLVLRLLRRHQRLERAYETALVRRADELEAFADRVAHDVRNALVPISLSVSQLARMDLGGSPHERVLVADRGVWRLFSLVEGLLAFAKAGAQPAASDNTDVADVIRDVVLAHQLSAEEAQCELRAATVEPGRVACNAGVLTSIIDNLVGNAIKHMDGPIRRVEIGSVVRGAVVRVTVDDTGPGVPEQLREAIFRPFVRGRTATAGVGLGLATVRRLADGHGGSAGVDPSPGGGSRFWIELPRVMTDAGAAPR
ncbi:MAG TPA: HAMP domain-containing sensor histidine kinase [Polyangia bacterium]|nr:HAMP domain-containing sensor histidine kinase [Polyangia bacterium]